VDAEPTVLRRGASLSLFVVTERERNGGLTFGRGRVVRDGVVYPEMILAAVLKFYPGGSWQPMAEHDPLAVEAVALVRAHGDVGALNRGR
jgi:hypothetical protein